MFGPGRRLQFDNDAPPSRPLVGALQFGNNNNIAPPPKIKRARMNAPVAHTVLPELNLGPMYTRRIHPYNSIADPAFYTFETCVRTSEGYKYLLQPPQLNRASRAFNERVATNFPTERYTTIEDLLDHPGVYTWLLYADSANPNNVSADKFIAGKALSPGEILSKHKNLHRAIRNSAGLLLAGEVRVSEDKGVVFNFISGTYMPGIVTSYKRRRRILQTNAINELRDFMSEKWSAGGATAVTFDPSVSDANTLIENNVAPNVLDAYVREGYTLSGPYETKDACMTAFRVAEEGRRATRNARRFGGKRGRKNKTR